VIEGAFSFVDDGSTRRRRAGLDVGGRGAEHVADHVITSPIT
jgi:hypothetical protein